MPKNSNDKSNSTFNTMSQRFRNATQHMRNRAMGYVNTYMGYQTNTQQSRAFTTSGRYRSMFTSGTYSSMFNRTSLLRGSGLFFGAVAIGYLFMNEYNRKKRHQGFERCEALFNGNFNPTDQDFLVSRALGSLSNDPGMPYHHKLHRNNSVASHQYNSEETNTKTGIDAQCVSVINNTTEAMPFPGVGDLYIISDENVSKDIYGKPAIYSGDGATQLKSARPKGLAGPKSRRVAYVRREHHLTDSDESRFTDAESRYQLNQLFELGGFQQKGKHNEVVSYLQGDMLAASFLFLKNPNNIEERAEQEMALVKQRTMHSLSGADISKVPVIEIVKNNNNYEMVNREDLANKSFSSSIRTVLRNKTNEQEKMDMVTTLLKSFYAAKSPAKKNPFTPGSLFTNCYVHYIMFTCGSDISFSQLKKIRGTIQDFTKAAELDRTNRKERFNIMQSMAKYCKANEDLQSIVDNNEYDKVVDFHHDITGMPYYKFDYHASQKIKRIEITATNGEKYFFVIAPVGFNHNWRHNDGIQRYLTPKYMITDSDGNEIEDLDHLKSIRELYKKGEKE